jgi:hypothetical protein
MSTIPVTSDQGNVSIDLGQIQFDRSITANAVPTAAQMAEGAIAINLVDRKIFTKDHNGNVITLGRDYSGDIATAKSEAISTSNAYTDTQVTNLIGGADTANDTLGKLAGRIDQIAADAQSNIDNLTKEDVGLGNVQNYGISDSVSLTAATGGSESYASSAAANTAWQRGEDAEANALAYADQIKSDILGGAPPAALDTLTELAAALADNDSDIAAINAAIAERATITYVDTELAKKLDASLLSDVNDATDRAYAPGNVASSKAVVDLRTALTTSINDGLALKVDKASISDAIDSTSTTNVASSKAVNDAHAAAVAHAHSLITTFAASMDYGQTF